MDNLRVVDLNMLDVGRERKSTTTRQGISNNSRESESAAAAGYGRPDRSTVVHQRAQAAAVDRPVDRRRRAVDRPVDRLTLPNSQLGTVDRHGRPTVVFGLFSESC